MIFFSIGVVLSDANSSTDDAASVKIINIFLFFITLIFC